MNANACHSPLSELDLELWIAGAHEHGDYDRVQAHLRRCPSCQARLNRAQAQTEAFAALAVPPVIAALERSVEAAPPVRHYPTNGPMLSMFFAVAALLVVVLTPRPGPTPLNEEVYRIKGAEVSLEVFVDDGTSVVSSASRDRVYAGERLGFGYSTRRAGHLMIVGVDGAASPYLCFPQRGHSVSVQPTREVQTVNEAIRLDAQPGVEHLVALLCDEPIDFNAVKDQLKAAYRSGADLGRVREGCAQAEVQLHKGSQP